MYKRILVATDGSDTADRAVAHAIALAGEQGAAVRFVTVVNPRITGWGEFAGAEIDSLIDEAREILAKADEHARAAGLAPDSTPVEACERHIGQVIAQEALDWGADLVVMGTHGRKGVTRLVLGSVAEVALRMSRVPVLTIPPHEAEE